MSHAGYFRSNDHLVFEGDGEYPLFFILLPKPPTAMQLYLHFSYKVGSGYEITLFPIP